MLRRFALTACALGAAQGAEAASLDGAGRVVILPFAVSGPQRESTIYITNPSSRYINVHAYYVGAEGTPFAASTQPGAGWITCDVTDLDPGESIGRTLASLCPISTRDKQNLGYLELVTYGGFDAAPFEVSSLVDVKGAGHFGVEGVPGAVLDPSRALSERKWALRVHDLIGDVGGMPPEFRADCAIATLDFPKSVMVQLLEYSTGVTRPLGSPLAVTLAPWRMVVFGDILRLAGVPPGRSANVTAEIYDFPAAAVPDNPFMAWCSVANLPSQLEDVRLAETPAPRDPGRSRSIVRGDSFFEVGPFTIGIALPFFQKMRMSVYLRHEDRVRCYLTESVVLPNWGAVPWQELRVIDPDGNVVAGGDNISDTGIFYTGVKNERNEGVNGRWTIEVSWRETKPNDYSQVPGRGHYTQLFGIACTSTNGLSQLLPLGIASDDF